MARKSKPAAVQLPAVIADPESTKRAAQVFLWIVQGQTEQDIREAIAATWTGQDAQPLIAFAVDEIKKSADYDSESVHGWCFEAYRELYRQCLAAQDFSGAIRAVTMLRDMAKNGKRQPATEDE